MKKQLSIAMLLALGTSVVSAAWLDYGRVFDENHDFWYSNNVNISVEGFKTSEDGKNFLKITSPVLRDSKDTAVGDYHIVLWEKPMQNYIDNKRDDLKELDVISIMDINESVDLSIKEGQVTDDRSYYWIVVPVNDNVIPGDYSEEFCFDFWNLTYAIGEDCSNFGRPAKVDTPEVETTAADEANTDDSETKELTVALNEEDDEHWAATEGADMSMADISHSVNGNIVTLTWTTVPYSENVEIRVFDKASADYITLGTVPMKQERFQYTVKDSDEELLFAFIPRDAKGREYRYDANVRHETDINPEIKATPKVGPAEDFAMILLITVGLYIAYRIFASRKAS